MAEQKQQAFLPGCLAFILVGLAFTWGLRACSRQDEKVEAERHQAVVQEEADDRAKAKTFDMSYEDYRDARWASNQAYAACKVAAEGRAKRDYKADFIPSSSWTVHNKTISVVGHDLQMENGFGAYEPVTYFCDWSMDTKRVVSLNLTED